MIILITPTGARPRQIELCAQFMKNQDYKGVVLWIIIDDAVLRTTDFIKDDFKKEWIIKKIYPVPSWRIGQNTQGRNIAAGINFIKDYKDIEAIFIIEDDDYYRPEYLTEMMKRMQGFRVVGETNTLYYNVYFRRYAANGNFQHSSLFQTAFTMDAVPIFRRCYMDKFIDAKFYQLLSGNGVNLFSANNLGVGIKGIAGRPGIGAGHLRMTGMRPDPTLNFLTSIIGEDAKLYERYYGGRNM